MTTDQIMQMIYLGLLAAAIGGSFWVSNKDNLGKMVQQAAIWVLIFIGIIGAYGLWGDISRDLGTRQAVFNDERVEVPRNSDGHYYLTLDINSTPVRFVVDTGASQIVLAQQDARKVGIDPDTLAYIGTANTANGLVRTAPTTLSQIELGGIRDVDIGAVVNGGEMDTSLLGMTYLNRYQRIEISGNRMVLIR